LAIAAGIKNIKAITAVQTPDGGGGGGGNLSNSFSGSAAQAPSFNVVGNSGINQLAQLQQQPMQAYVVSGSVTTAQSLDRNRIENATL
jgi:GTPase involved in cell partitioning and DNA repair